ncbi:hypothetical protein ACTMU2_17450 [Cupriavidus basilensis]
MLQDVQDQATSHSRRHWLVDEVEDALERGCWRQGPCCCEARRRRKIAQAICTA